MAFRKYPLTHAIGSLDKKISYCLERADLKSGIALQHGDSGYAKRQFSDSQCG